LTISEKEIMETQKKKKKKKERKKEREATGPQLAV
jgi:hypothetical protein